MARCKDCSWVHEADSVAKTSYMGVELCPVHANAPLMVIRERIINMELVIERDCHAAAVKRYREGATVLLAALERAVASQQLNKVDDLQARAAIAATKEML